MNLKINDKLMKSDGNYEIINTIKLIKELKLMYIILK